MLAAIKFVIRIEGEPRASSNSNEVFTDIALFPLQISYKGNAGLHEPRAPEVTTLPKLVTNGYHSWQDAFCSTQPNTVLRLHFTGRSMTSINP